MSAHTPGPWEVVRQMDFDGGTDSMMAEKIGPFSIEWHDDLNTQNTDRVEADISVASAAPNLLEALEEINTKVGRLFTAMGHGMKISEQAWVEAFAALRKGHEAARKARGEA